MFYDEYTVTARCTKIRGICPVGKMLYQMLEGAIVRRTEQEWDWGPENAEEEIEWEQLVRRVWRQHLALCGNTENLQYQHNVILVISASYAGDCYQYGHGCAQSLITKNVAPVLTGDKQIDYVMHWQEEYNCFLTTFLEERQ